MAKAYVKALKAFDFPVDFPGHFVSGEFLKCKRGSLVKDIINPSSGNVLSTIRLDKNLLDQAFTTAVGFESQLAQTSVDERFGMLKKFRQALVDYRIEAIIAMQLEGGKPNREAEQEFEAALRFLDHMISKEESLFSDLTALLQAADPSVSIELRPVGTTFAHIPFTTPCTSLVKFFTVSLIAGGPLVVMASAHASLFSTLIAFVVSELDFPKGLLSVLCGNFEMFRSGCLDRRVKAVVYRGSREHSLTIRQENFENLGRPAIIQSGGKNAAVIHPSAKMEDAVPIVLYGALKSAGQLCTSTSRVFVPSEKLPEFTDLVVSHIRAMEIGPTDSLAANPAMGPLYSRKAVDKFLRFQTMAKREARNTILWGKTIDNGTGGFLVSPGVHFMSGLNNKSAYQSNVLLFPDLAVYEYSQFSQAVAGANSVDAPLVTTLITQDKSIIDSHQFFAPNLAVNTPTVESESQLPVAGRGVCGSVRHNGINLVESLTYPVSCTFSAKPEDMVLSWLGLKI